MIWFKESIESWREVMTVNDVNILMSAILSLLMGNFCTCSKTVY